MKMQNQAQCYLYVTEFSSVCIFVISKFQFRVTELYIPIFINKNKDNFQYNYYMGSYTLKKVLAFLLLAALTFCSLKFRPFPQVYQGESIWEIITPKYAVRQSINPNIKSLWRDNNYVLKQISRQINIDNQRFNPKLGYAPIQGLNLRENQNTRLLIPSANIYFVDKFDRGRERTPQPKSFTNKQTIRGIIWPWMTSTGSSLTPINTAIQSKVQEDSPGKTCNLAVYDFSNPSENLINSDQPLDNLYPGAFVQGRYVENGSQTLVKLHISHIHRYPIRIGGNGDFQPTWTKSSQGADTHQKIKQIILKSQGYYSSQVYLKILRSQEISQLLVTLNVNAKISSKLGISGGFSGNWKTKKKRYSIAMIQGIAKFFCDKYVSDGSSMNDPVGVFLKESFTVDDLNNLINLGQAGPNNIPMFVDEVLYGRLMIVTVEENQRTQSLYGQIQASGLKFNINTSLTLTKMFQDSTLKVFSVGPFDQIQTQKLKSGQWQSFFKPLHGSSATIKSMRPIGFRLKDFKDQPVKVSNRLQYDQFQCSTKKQLKIEIQLNNVNKQAILKYSRSDTGDFTQIQKFTGNSGKFDITSYIVGPSDQFKIHLRRAVFKRKGQLTVFVNGDQIFKQKSECNFPCKKDLDAFLCYQIDKYQNTIKCKKY